MTQKKACQKEYIINIIYDDNSNQVISGRAGRTLVDVLQEHQIPIVTNCGGQMKCDSCKIKLVHQKQYVRSCQYHLNEDITIELPSTIKEEHNRIITTQIQKAADSMTHYGIAVDIGTTTLGFALVDLNSGSTIETYGAFNEQRRYGADVSSRILYGSNKDGLAELQDIILTNLLDGFKQLKVDLKQVAKVALSGNTTMLHLLRGLDPKSLGEYPFTPVDIDSKSLSFYDVFHNNLCECMVEITPCASAYIGSDVVVGAAHLSLDRSHAYQLLVDLGTNGEIVLGNNEHLYSTSTAAGPAFETSFRRQGINSTKGIDLIADGLRRGFIAKDGRLADRFLSQGLVDQSGVIIDQKTIRDIQLAKGAICAGIEILTGTYNVSYNEIESVYLAGGFGFHLTVENAIYIGLIPKPLKHKFKVAGNTSLQGTIRYLCEKKFNEHVNSLAKKIKNLDLANEENFQEKFIKCLDFSGN